jgi:iron complex outermembrane receptor protein
VLNTLKLFLAGCLILLQVWVLSAGNPPKKFALNIQVIDSATLKPLESASININPLHIQTITNQFGYANIDSVTRGWYTLQCSFVGYHPLQKNIWLDDNMQITLMLCAANTHLHEVEIVSHTDEPPTYGLQTKQILDALHIQRNQGAAIAEQLKQLSGVFVLNSGPAISKPVIRGLHSNRLVTVNNGIRQEGQQWGADHGTEVDPFSADRIEVIKGAASVEFGAEAIGGVIRLLPTAFKNTVGIDGKIQLNGATNNGLGAESVWLEGKTKYGLSWQAQTSARKAGDSRAPNYVLSNTGFSEWGANYALHYAYKKWHTEFSQSYFSSTMGILRAAHVGNTTDLMLALSTGKPTYQAPFTYTIDKPNQEVTHLVTALKTYYLLTKGHKLQLQVSMQNNARKEYDRPARWATSQQANPTPQYYLQLTTTLAEAKFEHAKWKNIKGLWGTSFMNQGNVSEGLQPIIPNFRAYTYGVFVIEKWQKKRWVAEAGLRYDWRNQTIFKLVNKVVQSQGNTYQNATFSSGVGYWFTDNLKVTAQVASAWRAPSINELFSNGLHGGTATYEIGNANLKPERSLNTEVEVNYTQSKWQMQVSAYHNYISNFIYKTPLLQPIITVRGAFPQFAFVQNNALLKGIDAQAKRVFNKNWNSALNLSYLYAQNTSTQAPLIFMPTNRLRWSIGYEKERIGKLHDIFAEVQLTYVAKQNRFEKGVDFIDPPPAYTLLDVHFGFETHVKKLHLNWSFSVYNVTNTSYRDYLSRFRYFAYDPGINFIARLAIPIQFYQPKNKTTH